MKTIGNVECRRLLRHQLGEDLRDHLVEPCGDGKNQQRQPSLLCHVQHGFRQFVEIAARFHGKCRDSSACETVDEVAEICIVEKLSGSPVAQREPGCHQQFVRLHPSEDVRHFHHVHRLNEVAQAPVPGKDFGSTQTGQLEDIPNRQSVVATFWQMLKLFARIFGRSIHVARLRSITRRTLSTVDENSLSK